MQILSTTKKFAFNLNKVDCFLAGTKMFKNPLLRQCKSIRIFRRMRLLKLFIRNDEIFRTKNFLTKSLHVTHEVCLLS